MKSMWIKRACSLLVAAVMAGAVCVPVAAEAPRAQVPPAEEAAAPASAATVESKDEVVYANLAGSGMVSEVYVVNEFEVTAGGTLTDYGDYTDVTNLTSTGELTNEGGKVTGAVGEGNFYYQGNLANTNLPWAFEFTYYLDGQKVEAAELAGQSGALEMRVASHQNPAVEGGFYDSYMLQISLTLDADKCSNIFSEGATVANAGKNKVITHTVMPGNDANITLTADVVDFTMSGIEIAALPYSLSIEMPDTDSMLGEVTTLTDAIDALDDGVGELTKGVDQLNSGVGRLASGSGEFAGGLNQLSGNSGQLLNGSNQIKAALEQIAASLTGGATAETAEGEAAPAGDFSLADVAQLPAGLRQIAGGLGQTVDGINHLKGGYASMYAALDAAIMAIPPVPEEDIGALTAAVNALPDDDPNKGPALNALGQLVASYAAGQTALGTYVTPDPATGVSIREGMGAVSGSLDTMAASLGTMQGSLVTMADGIEKAMSSSDTMEQLAQLGEGMTQMATQYDQFHQGLVQYTGGVVQVASGYGQLHNGIVELSSGTGELASGAHQLHNGTGELSDAVADLPETVELEIDDLMEEYTGTEFEPVSFTSDKNSNTTHVQFVMMTEGITVEEPEVQAEEDVGQESFMDRFLALFGGSDDK